MAVEGKVRILPKLRKEVLEQWTRKMEQIKKNCRICEENRRSLLHSCEFSVESPEKKLTMNDKRRERSD
ncbi:Glycerol kinase [Trichinella spiralis]|uniref:Glycerol kinase n=1 Tax=Trichinella spiralis TaxID=6334 RepID=A0ABR3KSW2_TRISP